MQGAAREIALDLVRADGTRLPVLVNSVLERDAAGEPRRDPHRGVRRDRAARATSASCCARSSRAEESEARAPALARTLQQTLIPPAPPHVAGLDIAAAYRPAGDGEEVGGDFYDVFELGAGDWVVVVGDVCGKGVDGGRRHRARPPHAARRRRSAGRSPRRRCTLLNEVLLARTRPSASAPSSCCGCSRDGADWLAVADLRRSPAAAARPRRRGTRAGRRARARWSGCCRRPSSATTSCGSGRRHSWCCYTDGVTEGRSGSEFYGETAARGRARTQRGQRRLAGARAAGRRARLPAGQRPRRHRDRRGQRAASRLSTAPRGASTFAAA